MAVPRTKELPATNMYTLGSLLPYAGLMTADFQSISIDEAGFISGFLASSFMLGRTLSSYFWGSVADRFGRVPVLIWSMLSIAILSIAFGMSSSLEMAVGIRLSMGLTSSIMTITQALTPELAGEERVVTAVGFYGGTRSLGLMVGTALGGILVEPAKHYPSVFSSTGVFGRYPYLLPNLLGACSACIAIPLIIIFVPETKNLNGGSYYCRRVKRGVEYRAAEADDDEGTIDATHARKPEKLQGLEEEEVGELREPGVFGPGGLLSIPNIPTLLLMTLLYAGCIVGLEELYPLWALSTVGAGGLEYSTVQIGKILGVAAVGLPLSQFLLYPRLVAWFGITQVQHVAGVLATVIPVVIPNVTFLSWDATSCVMLLIILIGIANCVQAMVNVGIQLAGTNPVLPRLRGKLSGLFLMAQSIGRAVGPVLFATTYAWSISPESRVIPLVDYRLTFTVSACFLGLVAVLGIRTLTTETMTQVPNDPPESPYKEVSPTALSGGEDMTSSPGARYEDASESIMVGDRRADLV